MDFSKILRPFPVDILPHLLSAHHTSPESQRAKIAMKTWNATGKQPCTEEDIEVLYEKLLVGQPMLLLKIGSMHVEAVQVLAAEHPEKCCCNVPLRAAETRCGELWSLSEQPVCVEVPQAVCMSCGRRYIGTWSYKAGVGPSQWEDVRASMAAHQGQYLYLVNHRRLVAVTMQVMRLIVSSIDKCRGSFMAVSQVSGTAWGAFRFHCFLFVFSSL